MKSFNLRIIIFLLLFFTSTSLFAVWQNILNGNGEFIINRNFSLLYGGAGTTLFGDFNATGDSILNTNNPNNADLLTDITTYKTVDPAFNTATYSSGDPEKMNSSSATINLPSFVQGSDIVWAGLFWQGHIFRPGSGMVYNTNAAVDSDIVGWNSVTMKDPNGVMYPITVPVGAANNDANHKAYFYKIRPNNGSSNNGGYRHFYAAYQDVTTIVQNSYSPTNNTFTVGNIKTTAGNDSSGYVYISHAIPPISGNNFSFGLYGGWSLIVVYSVNATTAAANSVPLKTVSIYDGYDLFLTWGTGTVPFQTDINISGFYTPKSGPVNSKLLLFGGAGDRNIGSDTLQIQNKKNVGIYNDLTNTTNGVGTQFNHTYSYLGNHMTPATAASRNKQGMDLDIFNVSNSMDNGQSSTNIRFGVVKSGSFCDQIFPQVIGFSTQVYEPKLCYDYAYSQYGQYFTEDYNASSSPRIVGDVDTSEPVTVKLYVKNMEASDVVAQNMQISILDLNTSQVEYIDDTTDVILPNDLTKTHISDSILSIPADHSSINNIPIGTMDSLEYYYTFYQLNPMTTDLDTPINARLDYNLTIATGPTTSVTIPYQLSLNDSNLGICKGTSVYDPGKGIFNIVHNDYYNLDVTSIPPSSQIAYYNIPTQVTSREGNFKVISLDENNTDQLKGRSTIVSVEMIDAAAFHDTKASCQDPTSSISERVWVTFDNNQTSTMFNKTALEDAIANFMTTLGNSADFYRESRQNSAFRISYNRTLDGNNDLVKITPNLSFPGKYSINFTELVQTASTCAQDMDGNTNNTDTIATYCDNNSDHMTKEDIAVCMECLYGYNTKFICSRDNFAIRPEAFLMHIDDQNQTNPTMQSRLTTNYSGVAAPTTPLPVINIAAGYKYNIEVTATNHLNTDASPGYIKTFNSVSTDSDRAGYIWEPRTGVTAGACNDDSNKSAVIHFMDGKVDTNTSVDQVGEYELSIIDTTWTAVDGDSSQMTHHTGAYFTNTLDCTPDSNRTYPVNTPINLTNLSNSLTGCNITSSHTGSSTSNLIYNNYDVVFHPYEFGVTYNVTLGENNTPASPILTDNNFIYMANISQDENASIQINTVITAKGKNSAGALSNFVTGCFAKPIDINITENSITPINNRLAKVYSFNDYNSTGQKIITTPEINGSIPAGGINITTTNGYFQKNMNGVLNTTTRLNFSREVNETANPEQITFNRYEVEDSNNTFASDLKLNDFADGYSDINQTATKKLSINLYYGRTGAKQTTIICQNTGTCSSGLNGQPDVLIYHDVFCNGVTGTNNCTPSFLPVNPNTNVQENSYMIGWFKNFDHNNSKDGNFSSTVDSTHPTWIGLPNGITYEHPDYILDSQHDFNTSHGLPYTAVMNDNVSRYLVHDENNATEIHNHHTVIFTPDIIRWTGEHEANSTTKTKFIPKMNRRTMW